MRTNTGKEKAKERIEVTPVMIEAGLGKMFFGTEGSIAEETVTAIFRGMLLASPAHPSE